MGGRRDDRTRAGGDFTRRHDDETHHRRHGCRRAVARLVAGGTWWAHRFGAAHASAHAATVYTCPMHPDYHSDHPGNCPICGMALEEDRAGAATGGDAAARALPPGAVQVSPERQQAIGVRLGVVSRIGRHAAAADDRARGGRTRTGRIRSSPP